MATSETFLREVRRALLAALALGGGIGLLGLALPLYALHVLDGPLAAASTASLILPTLLAGAAIAALACLEWVRERLLLRAGLWLDHRFGQHLLEGGLLRANAPAELDQNARALAQLSGALAYGTLVRACDAPWALVSLAVLVVLHPMLGAVTALFGGALALAMLARASTDARLEQTRTRAADRTQRWRQALSAQSGMLAALGFAAGATAHWERLNRAHIAGTYALGCRTSILDTLARTLHATGHLALLAVGGWLLVAHGLTPGTLVACLLLGARVLAPLAALPASLQALQAARIAYGRLAALPADATPPAAAAAQLASGLVLRDVTCHRSGRPVATLRNVGISLAPRRSLGITGAAGSGKSTLAALFAGVLLPSAGTVTLDGMPIAHWLRHDAPRIGYLPDAPLLLDGTVHHNIARFRTASLLAVSLAAMRAGLHDMLSALPQGYDTQVGPGGTALSHRERRAVALAGALFGSPALIVLDEPEFGLDSDGVGRLVRALDDLKRGGTSLVIATRNERLLELADDIVTLDAGAVHVLAASREGSAPTQFAHLAAAISQRLH